MKRSDTGYYTNTARFSAVLTGLGWFLFYFAVMLMLLHAVGTDSGLYHRLQMRAAILPDAGISEAELIRCDDALAQYLNGDETAPVDTMFGDDEIRHMQDCYDLFRLLRVCMWSFALIGAVLIVVGMVVFAYRGSRACMISALCMIVPILIAAVWAAIDFESLFTVFHKILFTNDLWLMDPKQQLMIRICPESMFVTMAVMIAAGTLVFILIVNLIHRVIFHKERRRNYAGL